MTLTAEILQAIREQPENVECRSTDGCIWLPLTEMQGMRLLGAVNNYQWRIKPKPYEARHVLYLDKTPEPIHPDNAHTLMNYLLGNNAWYHKPLPEEHCTKKYEIIVREIVE